MNFKTAKLWLQNLIHKQTIEYDEMDKDKKE